TFDISDGHGNPLKGMRVELRRTNGDLLDNQPINTVGGKYVFEQGLVPGNYVARATLVDRCPECDEAAFDIRYAPGPDGPVWVEWRVTVQSSQTQLFPLAFDQLDSNLQAYSIPGDAAPRLDDLANIYFRTNQYVDWVKTRLVGDPGPTVSFYTFATVDPIDHGSVQSTTSRYEPAGIIVMGVTASEYENRDGVADSGHLNDAPENVEWHEYTHHLYQMWIHNVDCPDAINHRGYNNPSSCDSFSEGFAIFLPTFAGHDLGAFNSVYAGVWDLQAPVKAWQYRSNGSNAEEFAVA